MLPPAALLGPLLLPPPLFEAKIEPLLGPPLLVRLLDPFLLFIPLAPDFSFQFLAPVKPPFRAPRPPWKPAEPPRLDRAVGFCDA